MLIAAVDRRALSGWVQPPWSSPKVPATFGTRICCCTKAVCERSLRSLKRASFVDLNFDSVTRVVPGTGLTQLEEIWLPTTVQSADIVISMPKIKTHHWAGVTLSLKNSFGILPGSIYGWPKNVLHWQGIDNSIVELAVSVPIHFVIADGIEAMEGNGPLHGPMRRLGCLVFADDPVAADATCCRLMGIDPSRVRHLQMASPLGKSGYEPNRTARRDR